MSKKSNITDMLQQAFRNQFAGFNVCLPGVIVSYDHTTQKAEAQPVVRRQYLDGQSDAMPVIANVPVVFPRSGGASITMPVKPGDTVLLMFADRAIDTWLQQGGIRNPNDRRLHSLNDAIAIPGLIPFVAGSMAENNDDMLVTYAGNKIRLKPGGNIEVEASNVTINSTTTNNGNVTINGNLTVSGLTTSAGFAGTDAGIGAAIAGNINATGDVTADGISLNSHVHGGVQTGGGTTGAPQ